jgi:RNA polymerase sigma factor (sigma-70 family)
VTSTAPRWAAQVWERHADELRRLLRRLAPASEVDDLVASTYEVLVRAHARLSDAVDKRLLVLGVGANLARHFHRGQRRRDRLAEAVTAQEPAGHDTPEDAFAARQLERDLEWAIAQLQPDHQVVMSLVKDGTSAAEISRLLAASEGTVRSRAYHARKRLKTLLQQRWQGLLVLGLLFASLALAAYAVVTHLRRAAPQVPVKTSAGAPRLLEEAPAEPEPEAARSPPERLLEPPRQGPSRPVRATPPPDEPRPAEAESATRPPSAPPPEDPARALFEAASHAQFQDLDFARAVQGWGAFLAQVPTGPLASDARFNRLVALFKLGRLAEARDAVEEALRLEPDGVHRGEIERVNALLDSVEDAPPR